MRYRGGGVGHLYMRAVEIWLAETGWGSSDTLVSIDEDITNLEEDAEDLEGSEGGEVGGDSEDEVPESDTTSDCTTGSDESSSDIDPDVEYESSENGEETVDGEYGFSGL